MTYKLHQAAVWPVSIMDRIRILIRGGLLIESTVSVHAAPDGSDPEIVDRSLTVAICSSSDRAVAVSSAPVAVVSGPRGESN